MSCPSGGLPPTQARFATGVAAAEGKPSKTDVPAGGMSGLEGLLVALIPRQDNKISYRRALSGPSGARTHDLEITGYPNFRSDLDFVFAISYVATQAPCVKSLLSVWNQLRPLPQIGVGISPAGLSVHRISRVFHQRFPFWRSQLESLLLYQLSYRPTECSPMRL